MVKDGEALYTSSTVKWYFLSRISSKIVGMKFSNFSVINLNIL